MRHEDPPRDAEWVRLLEAACPAAEPRPGAEERVLERVRQRRHEAVRAQPQRGRAVAAALAVACAFGLGIALGPWTRAPEQASAPAPRAIPAAPQPPELAASEPSGRPRKLVAKVDELVELERGARVLARAGTSIELSEGAELVECRLVQGEVLVHVPEGWRGTFAVVTALQRVEVTGTVFGVSSSREGAVAVTVWDGRVEVIAGAVSSGVPAGETWPRGAQPLRADDRDMARLAASARLVPEPLRREEPSTGQNRNAPAREDQYTRAQRLEADGEREEAARLYERVAAGSGATAEAASFAAARLYGGLSDHGSVRRVLGSYRARHPSGAYARAADVLWLRSLVAEGDSAGIEREAERFLRNHPDDPRAPQFRAARALDRARRGRCVEARFDLAGVDTGTREHLDELCPVASPGAR